MSLIDLGNVVYLSLSTVLLGSVSSSSDMISELSVGGHLGLDFH